MYFKENIFWDTFPESDSDTNYLNNVIYKLFKDNNISPDRFTLNVSEDKECKVVTDLLAQMDDEAFVIKSDEITFPNGLRKHYFIINKDAKILDIFYWAYPFATYQDGLEIILRKDGSESNILRDNPYDDKYLMSYYSEENMPLMLWATFRSIFKGDYIINMNSYKKDIDRIFRIYLREDNLNKRDAVSRAFAIAVKSLQKNGYLILGTRQPTDKGVKRGLDLEQIWGKKLTNDKFKQFEEILKQARS